MPEFLFQGSYIDEGLKGLATEGGAPRVDAARQLFGSLGGTLECFTSPSAQRKARGRVTPPLTQEEMDQVITRSPEYRAPGEP